MCSRSLFLSNRRKTWQGMGIRKSQPYPRLEPWQGTGTRKSPPYPGRKREELNLENADSLKKTCRIIDNTVYWYRRKCRYICKATRLGCSASGD